MKEDKEEIWSEKLEERLEKNEEDKKKARNPIKIAFIKKSVMKNYDLRLQLCLLDA